MKLNAYQIDFILDYFFTEKDMPGLRRIGHKMLTKGKCIVAGKDKASFGCVWDFVDVEEHEDFVDCLEHKMDVEKFLTSGFFKGVVEAKQEELRAEHRRLGMELASLGELLTK
jgi:hypothetical protein